MQDMGTSTTQVANSENDPIAYEELMAASELGVVPIRHSGRWVAAGLVSILVLLLLRSAMANPNYQWHIVGQYLFDERILRGLLLTLQLTFETLLLALVLGTAIALCRTSPSGLLRTVSWAYIWFFRGTPVLVQLIFWYNFAALYPQLTIGLPFGPTLLQVDSNSAINAMTAALVGLGFNQAAYMAEIIRSGLLSVDEGQREAASALGLNKRQIFRRIIAPQAMRVVVPPVGNLLIGLLKDTALVSVIALPVLLYAAQLIYAQNFRTIPILLTATIWYLVITTVLTVAQFYVERYFAKGATRNLPKTPLQKARDYLKSMGKLVQTSFDAKGARKR